MIEITNLVQLVVPHCLELRSSLICVNYNDLILLHRVLAIKTVKVAMLQTNHFEQTAASQIRYFTLAF